MKVLPFTIPVPIDQTIMTQQDLLHDNCDLLAFCAEQLMA